MSNIQNASPFSKTLGSVRVTVLGENKTTGLASIYSSLATVQDAGISLLVGTIRNIVREMTDVFYRTGKYAFTTTQNEILNDITSSMTIGYDGVWFGASRISTALTKDTLLEMIKGGAFLDGSDVVKVIGTNGTRKISPVSANNSFKYLLWESGKMSDPQSDDGTGKPIREENIRVKAYNKFACTIMIEFVFDNGEKKEGLRFAYALPDNITLTDDDDYTKVACDMKMLSDTNFCDAFYIDGVTGQTVTGAPTVDTNITEIAADYIFVTSADLAGTLTCSGGTIGDVVAIVDPTTAKVRVYQVTAAAVIAAIDANYILTAGCLISAPKYDALTVTAGDAPIAFGSITPTSTQSFVAVETAGTSGAALAATDKVYSAGSGTATRVFKAKDFVFSTNAWAAYTV